MSQNQEGKSARNSASNSTAKTRSGSQTSTDINSSNEKCMYCKVAILKKDKSLKCALCHTSFHTSCHDIDDLTYEAVLKDRKRETPLIKIYCSKQCNIAVDKYLTGVMSLEKEVKKIDETVKKIDEKVVALEEGKFTSQMIETVKAITETHCAEVILPQVSTATGAWSPISESKVEGLKSIISSQEKEQLAEMEDRISRKCNILVFRMEEKENKSIDNRMKEEKKKINKLLRASKTDHKPTEIRRLGKYNSNNPKPRPLKVSFESEKARDEVLKSFHRARKDNTDKEAIINKVNLQKDMTKKEREEDDELFAELKLKRTESQESGDEYAHWIRRKGKVINIGKYPTPEMEETDDSEGEDSSEEEEDDE